MFTALHTTLQTSLGQHFALGKSRLETLSVLIIGLINNRTVNLSHLASQFPHEALHASNYRRLQRFFQHIKLNETTLAHMVMSFLKLSGPKVLALDRTNWQVGSQDINILMLAVVTRRFRVPLMWALLDHGSNSCTSQRIALMQRYVDLFGAPSIDCLLAAQKIMGVCRGTMDGLFEPQQYPFYYSHQGKYTHCP